jgi:hypothetical protein
MLRCGPDHVFGIVQPERSLEYQLRLGSHENNKATKEHKRRNGFEWTAFGLCFLSLFAA